MADAIFRRWCDTVDRHPEKVALRQDGTGWTFGSLAERVDAFVAAMDPRHWQLWHNRIVVFQFPNAVDWLVAFLVCQKLGAIAAPIDPDVPCEGVEALCIRLRAHCLWTSAGHCPLADGRRYAAGCLIKLTSGTTGQPRALFFADDEMIADGEHIISGMKLSQEDRHLAVIPFGHSYGLGNLVMPLILQGAGLCLSENGLPHVVAGAIAAERATVFPAVPVLLRGLLRSSVAPESLSSLRMVISAGSPLIPEDASAFAERFGIKIHNFYGSSETGGIAFDSTGDCTLSGEAVGALLPGVRAEQKASGRLEVSSKAVFKRYNRKAAGGMGSHLLPDLGTVNPRGLVQLLGRRSRMIKLGGKRLDPSEVERQLLAIEGVDDAFVCGMADPNGRMRLAAAVQSPLDGRHLRRLLKQSLPSWKVPGRIVPLEKFPLNARGKANFSELERRLLSGLRPAK